MRQRSSVPNVWIARELNMAVPQAVSMHTGKFALTVKTNVEYDQLIQRFTKCLLCPPFFYPRHGTRNRNPKTRRLAQHNLDFTIGRNEHHLAMQSLRSLTRRDRKRRSAIIARTANPRARDTTDPHAGRSHLGRRRRWRRRRVVPRHRRGNTRISRAWCPP